MQKLDLVFDELKELFPKSKPFEGDNFVKVKVNKLSNEEVTSISSLCDKHQVKASIKRSGTGLTVLFK